MNYDVYYQVGLEIDNPMEFHALGTVQQNYVRGELYAHVLEIAQALKSEVYENLPPTDAVMLTDLQDMLPDDYVPDATPANVTVEHVYRNGHWICDTHMWLDFDGDDASHSVDVDPGDGSTTTIVAFYFVTISSPHDWEGK